MEATEANVGEIEFPSLASSRAQQRMGWSIHMMRSWQRKRNSAGKSTNHALPCWICKEPPGRAKANSLLEASHEKVHMVGERVDITSEFPEFSNKDAIYLILKTKICSTFGSRINNITRITPP